VARISGTLLVAFLLLMTIPSYISKGVPHNTTTSRIVMGIFFDLGNVGIILAWRWEGFGGFLAALSVIVAMLLSIFWVQGKASYIAFSFWLIPALLFIYCWWRTRRQSQPDPVDK